MREQRLDITTSFESGIAYRRAISEAISSVRQTTVSAACNTLRPKRRSRIRKGLESNSYQYAEFTSIADRWPRSSQTRPGTQGNHRT
jgi:hypothetical protein